MEDSDRLRHRAHQIWEAEGRPEGRDAEHWAQAQDELHREGGQGGDAVPDGNQNGSLSEVPAELAEDHGSHPDGRIVEAGEGGTAGGPDEAQEAVDSPVYPDAQDSR